MTPARLAALEEIGANFADEHLAAQAISELCAEIRRLEAERAALWCIWREQDSGTEGAPC